MWLMSDQLSQQFRQLSSLMQQIQDNWKNQQNNVADMARVNEEIVKAYQQYNLAYLSTIKSALANPAQQMLMSTWMQQLQLMNPEVVLRPILNQLEQMRPKNEALNNPDIKFVFQETRRLLDEVKKTIEAILKFQFDSWEKLGIDPEIVKLAKRHVEQMMELSKAQYQNYDAALKKLEDEYSALIENQNKDGNYDQMLKTIRQNTEMLGRQFDFMLKNINDFLQFKLPSAAAVVDAINSEMFRRKP